LHDSDCRAVAGACSAHDGESGICFARLDPRSVLRVATTEYLANGGSSLFTPISAVGRVHIADSLSAVMAEWARTGAPCGAHDCTGGCEADLLARADAACATDGRNTGCSERSLLCARAVETCAYLPCLDDRLGGARDGRIRIEAP
jgi:hypothetical protein